MFNGIPLHPLVVHAPIALLIFATFLLMGALRWSGLRLFAVITLVVGLLSGIIAYLTGDGAERFGMDQWNIARDSIHTHENFALYSLITFGLSLLLVLLDYRTKNKMIFLASILVALIGSGLLAYAGHLGGQMVYAR